MNRSEPASVLALQHLGINSTGHYCYLLVVKCQLTLLLAVYRAEPLLPTQCRFSHVLFPSMTSKVYCHWSFLGRATLHNSIGPKQPIGGCRARFKTADLLISESLRGRNLNRSSQRGGVKGLLVDNVTY